MEARKQRSDNPMEAVRLQLEASANGTAIAGMVLADEDGLCIASVGEGDNELAVVAAEICRETEDYDGMVCAEDNQWTARIRSFTAEGSRLFVCAIGGGREERAQKVSQSIVGLTRILAA